MRKYTAIFGMLFFIIGFCISQYKIKKYELEYLKKINLNNDKKLENIIKQKQEIDSIIQTKVKGGYVNFEEVNMAYNIIHGKSKVIISGSINNK